MKESRHVNFGAIQAIFLQLSWSQHKLAHSCQGRGQRSNGAINRNIHLFRSFCRGISNLVTPSLTVAELFQKEGGERAVRNRGENKTYPPPRGYVIIRSRRAETNYRINSLKTRDDTLQTEEMPVLKKTADVCKVQVGVTFTYMNCPGQFGLFGLVYWGLTPQQQPGSYQGGEMMMKSVFWWRKPEYPEETTDLRQVTDETCSSVYTSPHEHSRLSRGTRDQRPVLLLSCVRTDVAVRLLFYHVR